MSHLAQVREDLRRAKDAIEEAETLRFVLEHAVGKPLAGDFSRLHGLLEQTLLPLTTASLEALGEPKAIMEKGAQVAARLHLDEDGTDDVVRFVLGLEDLRGDFVQQAASWRGPKTPLRRAIELWGTSAVDAQGPAT